MFNVDEYMYNLEELEKLVADGEVAKRPHPTKDLFIYSYLKTWYPEWTDTLRWARGLILNSKGELIACPFKKFFNYSEIRAEVDGLINSGVEHAIQEKLDGSLGILFYYDGEWILSTKGSFSSVQAIKAREILEEKYPTYVDLDKDFTYLFEIIYPENQIVVQYKEEKLILLAVMDPTTMQEVTTQTWQSVFEWVRNYKELKISEVIKDMSRPEYCSSEGFVVVFENGTRVKFKYDEYVRLHKIVSDFKPKNVVEFMKSGQNVDDLITSLPDEFRQELEDVKISTQAHWYAIAIVILGIFHDINVEDKKTFALKACKEHDEYKHFLFELYKDYWQRGIKDLDIKHCQKNKNLNEMIYDRIIAKLNDPIETTTIFPAEANKIVYE